MEFGESFRELDFVAIDGDRSKGRSSDRASARKGRSVGSADMNHDTSARASSSSPPVRHSSRTWTTERDTGPNNHISMSKK